MIILKKIRNVVWIKHHHSVTLAVLMTQNQQELYEAVQRNLESPLYGGFVGEAHCLEPPLIHLCPKCLYLILIILATWKCITTKHT